MNHPAHLINRHSGIPLYKQIAGHLETELDHAYAPGDRLPVEAELAQRYDVNRLTVRQAIAEMVRRGLVETVQGKGTFVATPVIRYDIAAGRDASFTRTMRERGHLVETRLLKVRTDNDPELRRELDTGSELLRTDILRLVDDQPWSVTSTWLVPGRFPGLERKWTGASSLYTVLLDDYGVRMKRANRSFAALPADASDAEWLLLPVAAPILQVRGLNVDEAGRPIAVVEHHFRGDRLQFTMELQ
ncbi:phosphonate metabolism transcriptional regulator PhnF [Arthrobacter sulfonylureivorans]|uniref:Phosphonate metabolism transcriptional regulator PhnF n=1 Tax=Arthrobacter sulfonylureivorans TaxID=2486855 RepID=A0ABY3WEH8_9MICC|nr:phosphonate metabolism transcriptional regulator PhnF [Arthrobacter sulfonylureivorans]UNK47827.1 phosphonate metabolism transcriptional regulator PhnF [Arthrobacter sulfonylureivorans]